MVPEETRQVTDFLPKSQSKSDITQLDIPIMVCDGPMMPPAPDEDVSSRIPEISQPCVSLAEAASIELPLNVEEAFIRDEDNRTSHDFDDILGQVIPEVLAFHFLDPSSSSYQGAQGTWSPPSSSFLRQIITTAAESGPQVEHWASRTAPLGGGVNYSEVVHEGGGVQPPNISYDGPTVNASADTSLPNNPMGQNPQICFPSFRDIYDYQLEMLNREQGSLQNFFEETTSELKAELDRKMAEIQREYDRKSQEVDSEYINQAMKEEVYMSSVVMNSLLSNDFMSTCTDRSVATGIASVREARSSQPSTQQQQQTVQRNTHMNLTASPRSCVTVEAPIPNASAARSSEHSTQQQQAVQRNTHVNSTAPSQPPITSEAPISNPSAARNTQHPIQLQQAVQRNTHMNSTPPPRPEAPIPDLSNPLSHSPRYNTTQPRPISQQATVQSNTPMNSTALPQPSVTSVEPRPLQSPHSITAQPRPVSQQAMAQSNRHANSTTLSRPSVTSEALPLHSTLNNTPQSRAPPPLIPNHTPSSYSAAFTPPVQGVVRTMPPHLRSSRAPNFASAAASTTNQAHNSSADASTRLVQEQQQQQEKSNSGLVYLSDD